MAGLFDPSNIYNQLAAAGLLPEWSRQRPYGSEDGSYNPDRNKMIAAEATNSFNKGALAHETTHAAQYNFLYPSFNQIADKIKQGSDISPVEMQYYEAAKKLLGVQPIGRFSTVEDKTNKDSLKKAIDLLYKGKEGSDSYKYYRTQPIELQAFGVGNMSQGAMHASTKNQLIGSDYHPHLDPSFASEFDILMSLYNKLPSNVKQDSIKRRKESIKSNNQYLGPDKKDEYYTYENINKDPFASSIK